MKPKQFIIVDPGQAKMWPDFYFAGESTVDGRPLFTQKQGVAFLFNSKSEAYGQMMRSAAFQKCEVREV